jgi:hypothetical protein
VEDYRVRRERWSLGEGRVAKSYRFSGEMHVQDKKTYHFFHRTR